MPRDIPVGNGRLLINFDKSYNVRDIYWPHVGQELHTAGDVSHTGVWVDGKFAWLDAPEWQRTMAYVPETLVTEVTLTHPGLQLQLLFHDTVDFYRPLFLRHVQITNQAESAREVRLFFHYDWHICGDVDGNTVLYYPAAQALVAYKDRTYFLMGGQVGSGAQVQQGITSWSTGIKEFNGSEGTWRDAEDGVLSRNPIAQGSVDGTLELAVPSIAPHAISEVYHWLVAGEAMPDVTNLNTMVQTQGPALFLQRTQNYWHAWVNKEQQGFADLSPELVALYKQSLLILRTQIDYDGAIVAANDADMQRFFRDSYSYMWPRDGSLVATALSHAGYSEITRNFYEFCHSVITEGGYLLHKYNPDRSWGSSWHPWIDKNGVSQLPIQEDETALVIYSLWQHYDLFHDIEFVSSLYRDVVVAGANFLISYREPTTHLPAASYDLWEERRGILSYTTATVYAGLMAAANFSTLFGEESLAATYRQTAAEIKEAALRYLWDDTHGHFVRMINVAPDGTLQKDLVLDSSLCGLFQFGMFAPDDPHIEQTMQKLEQTLWAKTAVGGMARYENDNYYQVTQDLSQAQGNPWFICTLWLAQYRIAHSTTIDELHQALPLLRWVYDHALASGVMAEQVHPFTSEPLSVSPLTWSHAEYVMTVRWYLGHLERLEHSVQ
ncbi:glycoside hydrolase family 15 protein [Dictyobacter arantiisoli]|uniref:Glucan 1,3-alpha-glucosidase n=1 Tax=Dictyobacter arantiisoli TaxID=2014874 RepID=A0A5A5T627_9CHLR|nr:glycoside hydrolase family 15 protein [Dictyobacter arantiisoli]GCF06646.1 glucan 1,3-alpha-glucosidase [Dictyobacter arantiisoli]